MEFKYKGREKEYHRKYSREWRKKNPEKAREASRRNYQKHKEERRKRDKERYCKNRERILRKNKEWRERHRGRELKRKRELKIQIITLLGGKCVHCGFSDIRALQIDHVYDNGSQERKKFRSYSSYYKNILKKIKSGSKDYQCLCANCNVIKEWERRRSVTA